MICLDSDAIIDYLKGNKAVMEIVKKHFHEVFTTEINIFEIFYGIYLRNGLSGEEESTANTFFNSIKVLSFDKPCGKIATKIFTSLMLKGIEIEQNDCFIVSIILNNGFDKIVTKNKKHFSRIKELEVISY